LPSGAYRLTVYVHSVVSGQFSLSRTVNINVVGPLMSVDAPGNNAVVSIGDNIGGWAIDRGGAGPGVDAVHVWAFPAAGGAPIFVGAASIGNWRGDVAGAFGGQYLYSGFNLALANTPSGQAYDLVLSARSTLTGVFNQSRSIRVWVR